MDPIQKLISGADPLRDDTAEVPDADAALRGALAGPPVFSDGLPANVVPFVERRRSRARLLTAPSTSSCGTGRWRRC